MAKNFQFIIIGAIIFFSVIVLFIANTTLQTKTSELKKRVYLSTTEKLHTQIDLLIKNKKQSTLSLALALSRDTFMINALQEGDAAKLRLDELSLQLREFTRFKNVWFQIIDKNGYCFYRSWIDKKGDQIASSRVDLQTMMANPQVISSISVGKFDMTFKSMVPIYDSHNSFLGTFEIITHFNSISRKLREDGFEAIILSDKKYKNQLQFPFTKMFIEDYYVANLDANSKLMKIVESKGVESYLGDKTLYQIDTGNKLYFTMYPLATITNNTLGYLIVFKSLDTFSMENVKSTQKNIIVTMIFIILFIMILGYYLFNQKYNSLLKKNLDFTKEERNKIKAILSAQPYIIMLINENGTYDVNDEFFQFFPKYKNLQEFKKEIECIYRLFVKPDNDDGTYIYDNADWIELLKEKKGVVHKVAMYKNEELHHFILKVSNPKIKKIKSSFTILTFIDITEQKKKDKLLFEQSKNASMGEMIGNIAHQWRQPLSIISTAATGMLMHKKLNILEDEDFEESCNKINTNAQYLSKTIDDFRNFLKGESKVESFNINDAITSLFHLVESVAKVNNIKIVTNIQQNLIIKGNQNELLQCFINIFNNSRDAFLLHPKMEKRYFFIDIFLSDKKKVKIVFKDNAGGIDPKIIGKVFEPYFTTKHQSQGTGLGLSMTYTLITSQMRGEIFVSNEKFEYEGINYQGAQFTISLNI